MHFRLPWQRRSRRGHPFGLIASTNRPLKPQSADSIKAQQLAPTEQIRLGQETGAPA